jgi:hypothetical protein
LLKTAGKYTSEQLSVRFRGYIDLGPRVGVGAHHYSSRPK